MKYDAIVIGSGQGGGPLAHRLADLGWQVALVEQKYLGGACINAGCTPPKTMVASAQVAHYARNSAPWGVHTTGVSVNLAEIVARKAKVVESFRAGQQRNVDKRPTLRLYQAKARFTGPHSLQVGDEILESEKIFIDTGARPAIPSIPGLDSVDYLTNVSLLEVTELPEHLLILGGGYIGLEFCQMFRRFGSEVTVIQQGGQILPREDAEIAAELQRALEAEGIRFLLNAH